MAISQKLILELKNILIILKLLNAQTSIMVMQLRCAKIYKIKALTVNELLKDKELKLFLNLTIPKAHYKVAKAGIE